ncbi:hypothetical protein SAMN04487782_2617 [Stenotrophomonas maltophilia]|nr:hypothetical protein SAMN04487782_2617 [Stenotrophomonas maltophilia]
MFGGATKAAWDLRSQITDCLPQLTSAWATEWVTTSTDIRRAVRIHYLQKLVFGSKMYPAVGIKQSAGAGPCG